MTGNALLHVSVASFSAGVLHEKEVTFVAENYLNTLLPIVCRIAEFYDYGNCLIIFLHVCYCKNRNA